jgi:hypothetical protein
MIVRYFFHFHLFRRDNLEGHQIGRAALQGELHLPDRGLLLAGNRDIGIIFSQPGQKWELDIRRHEGGEEGVHHSNALVNRILLIGAGGNDLDLA